MYSIKHMARKLEKQYGKDIVSKQDGKPSIVCFRNVADHISKIFQKQRNTEAIRM